MSNVFPLFVLFVGFVVLVILLLSSIRIIYEYERGIVLTLGKYSGLRNPGLTLIFPIIQELRKVDMRIKTADIPKQEVMTKDNIPIMINAVVYFRVENPVDAILKIEDYQYAVSRYTLAALRDVIGNHELDFVLTERQKISESIKKIVDVETSEWGVDIDSIKIQEIELPAEMKRAIAKQAEAERERRAVIIASEGELKASENLMKAALTLSKSKGSLLLRTLQTVRDIAADPSEKIVIVLPVEIQEMLGKILK